MTTNTGEEKNNKETFGSNLGEGLGCFFILLGLAIFFSFPAILALIGKILTK